jgi:tRNA threonylcarbamoyladenosine biosynthesis protein TsaB
MSETLLLLDSCTADLVVAVARDGAVLAGRAEAAGPLKGARLLPLAEEVMAEAGVAYADLTGVAAGRGPGMFTGIRTGLATALGIAKGRGIACWGLCPLLALAAGIGDPAQFPAAVQMDARKGEVYCRLVGRLGDGLLILLSDPFIANAGALLSQMAVSIHPPGTLRITPEGLLASLNSSRASGEMLPALPLYIRPSDARPLR